MFGTNLGNGLFSFDGTEGNLGFFLGTECPLFFIHVYIILCPLIFVNFVSNFSRPLYWLSDWLLSDIDRVKSLIEESINNHHLENFWKDEVLVSVLLSNYAGFFFQMFEKKLLEDNEKLLMRVVFLLRIACKTIDEDMSRLLGLPNTGVLALEIVFTMPKGKGLGDCDRFPVSAQRGIWLTQHEHYFATAF